MKLIICVFAFLLANSNLFAAVDHQAEYESTQEKWTGNNNFSSAPTPYCGCDEDADEKDCDESFAGEDVGKVCYDEYIPSGSKGWAHAIVFERK